MYSIQITEPARQDLYQIMRYISSDLHNPDAAEKLLTDIEQSVLHLKTAPHSHAVIDMDDLKPKEIRFITVKNYLVFYQVHQQNQSVSILRILYGRRNWQSLLQSKE